MSLKMTASHIKQETFVDKIFGASLAAQNRVLEVGKEKVVNAVIGAICDEEERLICLPGVEKMFREIPTAEFVNYAPLAGLPKYLNAVERAVFGEQKPEAYIASVATAGGSGVIHHSIWNYSERNDAVLTHDWFWSPYGIITESAERKIETFRFFDEKLNFNLPSFMSKVNDLLLKQQSLLMILNTPGHNPTGYSIKDQEWDTIIAFLKETAQKTSKKITVLIDIAYIDYAGQTEKVRAFMKKLTSLPQNLLFLFAFSMSKSFTLYGQRTGAIVGLSSFKEVITDFEQANKSLGRATWSNINRGCMYILGEIYENDELRASIDKERLFYYELVQKRVQVFMQEAENIALNILPYCGGFFITLPYHDADGLYARLAEQNLFTVPLARGIRIAVCSVPIQKISGLAQKIKDLM